MESIFQNEIFSIVKKYLWAFSALRSNAIGEKIIWAAITFGILMYMISIIFILLTTHRGFFYLKTVHGLVAGVWIGLVAAVACCVAGAGFVVYMGMIAAAGSLG